MLHILYGKPGCGKTSHCIDVINNKVLAGHADYVYLIVPENFTLFYEQLLHNEERNLPIEVLSFGRFINSLCVKQISLQESFADETIRAMLMQKALHNVSSDLSVLKDAVGYDDFCEQMLSMVTQLNQQNVSIESLSEKINDMPDDTLLKYKLADIAAIFGEYDNLLKEYQKTSDTFAQALEAISDMQSNACIAIDGFYDFSQREYMLINALLCKDIELYITFTCNNLDDKQDVYINTKKAAKKIIALAAQNNVEVAEKHLPSNDSFFINLSDNYFKYPPVVCRADTSAVTLLRQHDVYEEAEQISCEIVRLCREQGVRLNQIAVISRNLTSNLSIVAQTMETYGIVYRYSAAKSAALHSFSQCIMQILAVMANPFTHDGMFEWLKSPYSPYTTFDVSLLENYVLAAGVKHYLWSKDWSFTPAGMNYSDNVMERINSIRNAVTSPFVESLHSLSGTKTVGDIIAALLKFIDDVSIPEKVRVISQKYKLNSEILQYKELLHTYNAIMTILEQMQSILGEQSITIAKFAAILNAALANITVSEIPPAVDGVTLSELDKFCGQQADYVFVLGVNDGVFPKPHKHSGILSQKEVQTLHSHGILLHQDNTYLYNLENYYIYRTLNSARKRLYLSCPLSGANANSLAPSQILKRVAKILPNHLALNYKRDDVAAIESANASFYTILRSGGNKWVHAKKWYEQNCAEMFSISSNKMRYSTIPINLMPNDARRLFGSELYFSISRAEQYAACEFAYFCRYGIAAKPRRVYSFSPPDIGSILHEIVDGIATFTAKNNGWAETDISSLEQAAAEITAATLSKRLNDSMKQSPSFPYIMAKIQRIVLYVLGNIKQYYDSSPFVQLGSEIEFGREGLPPFVLALEDGSEVKLIGKVDRADILDTKDGRYIAVVDYKSSAKSVEYGAILTGTQLQLPVYLTMLCNQLSNESSTIYPAAFFYYHLDYPIISTDRDVDDEEIAKKLMLEQRMKGLRQSVPHDALENAYVAGELLEAGEMNAICKTAIKSLKSGLQSLLGGKIRINPYKGSCDYCDYKAVCQFDQTNGAYRKMPKLSAKELIKDELDR